MESGYDLHRLIDDFKGMVKIAKASSTINNAKNDAAQIRMHLLAALQMRNTLLNGHRKPPAISKLSIATIYYK